MHPYLLSCLIVLLPLIGNAQKKGKTTNSTKTERAIHYELIANAIQATAEGKLATAADFYSQALGVVLSFPKWTPAVFKDEMVAFQMILPVRFTLR